MISFDKLYIAAPSPRARRLLWHVLSAGPVSRNEPEHHQGLDKAGLFLFQVAAGSGQLEVAGERYALERGNRCWLLDLRQPRSYLPSGGRTLRTEGVRFSGPGLEGWLEVLGPDPVFDLPAGTVRLRLKRLRALVRQRGTRSEWQVHLELTALWGELLGARRVFGAQEGAVSPAVQRVLDAVFADPTRDWRAQELARVGGISYSRLREEFRRTQGRTLHEFLQSARLDIARQLLSDRRLTIKEVAQELNFSSQFYFSHFFRRGTGMSPTQFRARCRA